MRNLNAERIGRIRKSGFCVRVLRRDQLNE
jgi:hypothetical protein